MPPDGRDPRAFTPSTPPDASSSSAPLTAGSTIAGRYRIVASLGKGGMGEVYRADDLTLASTVALKFLPAALAHDPLRLERFRAEVKLARQVSHANACRVYDIVQADGRVFIAMEYIDGEDLASLLRRIGRLPREKAVDAARQLCFGLAAIHDAGLIHRDLKPGNIMVDGRGKIRITDFGLAAADQVAPDGTRSGAITGAAARAGTPLYMAPEQLAGVSADRQSDVYALGLVLYELFTGRHALGLGPGATWADLQRVHSSSHDHSNPSTHVPDIDPAAERAIMRCLQREPQRRPRSAIAVAAALPGGDALAAALAAGETPSPEMVAQAGLAEGQGAGGLAPRVAALLGIVTLLAWVLAAVVVQRHALLRIAPTELAPDVLAQKARETIGTLGYSTKGGWSASGFTPDTSILQDAAAGALGSGTPREVQQRLVDHVTSGTLPGLLFWYRWSPRPITNVGTAGAERVRPDTRPLYWTGDVLVFLDSLGRLVGFEGVPPALQGQPLADRSAAAPASSSDAPGSAESTGSTALAAGEPDWSRVLALAGFDINALTPATPVRTPWHSADTRRAWTGVWPSASSATARVPVHIEAMSERGRLVAFRTLQAWDTQAPRTLPPDADSSRNAWLSRAVILSIFVASNVLGIINVRAGRCDMRGTRRLALSVGVLVWVSGILLAPSVRAMLDPEQQLGTTMAAAAWNAAVCVMLYLALEPLVRRFWPEQIITWVRLLEGRVRDPRLCADVVWGCAVGAALAILLTAWPEVADALGLGVAGITSRGLDHIDSWRFALGTTLQWGAAAARFAIVSAFMLVLGTLLLRVRWAGVVAGGLGIMLLEGVDGSGLLTAAAVGAGMTGLLITRGLVAAVASVLCTRIMTGVPFMLDPTHWVSPSTFLTMAAFVALMTWCIVHATRGRASQIDTP